MELNRPRRSLPADLPPELLAVISLLCVAGLFTGIPVLQDLPDAFRFLADGGLWDSLALLVVVLFLELGFLAVAYFILAWRLSQGDPVARVVTVAVCGSLAFGLLAGNGFDDGSATVTMLCSIAVMAILLIAPRAREFFADRPPGATATQVVAAEVLVVMLAVIMLAVGLAYLPAGSVKAKYGFAGLALAGIAIVCLKDRRRLQTGDPAARSQVSGLMAGAALAIVMGNEGSLTGALFIPLGMAVAIVGLLWLPKESQAFFDAGGSLDVDVSDDEDVYEYAPPPGEPLGPSPSLSLADGSPYELDPEPPADGSPFELDPAPPASRYPSSTPGMPPFAPGPAPSSLPFAPGPSPATLPPFAPDPAPSTSPPFEPGPAPSTLPPFAPVPAPSAQPPPPPPPATPVPSLHPSSPSPRSPFAPEPAPPSVRPSPPRSEPTMVGTQPSLPPPPIPPPVFGRRTTAAATGLAASPPASGRPPSRPAAKGPAPSPPAWLLEAPPAGFWPPERPRTDPRRYQVIEVDASSPDELQAAPDLGIRFDTTSWFPVLEAGEQVRGAYLVSMAMFDDGSATTAFRGTSTLLVTTARLVGVCARGDSATGPLDPAEGRVVVWRVVLDQIDRVQAEGSAEGGHLALKGRESERPWALLAKPRVAVEGAFRPSSLVELAELVNRAKHATA